MFFRLILKMLSDISKKEPIGKVVINNKTFHNATISILNDVYDTRAIQLLVSENERSEIIDMPIIADRKLEEEYEIVITRTLKEVSFEIEEYLDNKTVISCYGIKLDTFDEALKNSPLKDWITVNANYIFIQA